MDELESAFDEVTISHRPNPHSGDKEPLLELSPIHIHSIDTLSETISRLKCLDGEQLLSFAGELFSIVAERQQVHVPTDFLPLSLSAMKQLESGGRSNILYPFLEMISAYVKPMEHGRVNNQHVVSMNDYGFRFDQVSGFSNYKPETTIRSSSSSTSREVLSASGETVSTGVPLAERGCSTVVQKVHLSASTI